MSFRPFAVHLLFMFLGYTLAVLVCVCVELVFMSIASPRSIFGGSRWYLAGSRNFQSVFSLGVFLAVIQTFPFWLVTVIIAEVSKERRWRWFAAAGAATAILLVSSVGIITGSWQDMLAQPVYFGGTPVGWFFGVMVYWAVAGRRSGQWRGPLVPSIRDGSADEGALK
jgi:hypothetical protein